MLCLVFLFHSCKKEDNSDNKGFIEFKTSNSITLSQNSSSLLKSALVNPPLTRDTTLVHLVSLNLIIADVWVSQGVVRAEEADNMEWVRLTNTTNTQTKLFEDYSFSAADIPAGNYQSIKITFGNEFYRHVQLASDPSVKYELIEWMDSSGSSVTNYFGPGGNHRLVNGKFISTSAGEKIGGFIIEADRTAIVTWRLFAGATEACPEYLIDNNGNLEWDDGIDSMVELDCPGLTYMWDFVVEYQ